MSHQIEPTYLRYIYDGLAKGAIHPDNASALPDGLIGLYEEAFNENITVSERQKLLQCFTILALLKKEVSANFVAEVLNEKEEDILNFIATYSKWFNSPESGKFQLYHERLRVFLLQKLPGHEVKAIQKQLIARLETAIEEKKADEVEYYALQYLSHHLMVEAFANADGKSLLAFTKSDVNWDRQILLSNKFDWSKQGLHHAALWTSKHDQEGNIFCYLDLVQLHNKEQNDAESIVRLVAENQIDLALERITAFGGPSQEEKERQFILFMLCLMELTLLESKILPLCKQAIEKLLNHMEKEIPVDHSLFDWGGFYPTYLVFLISVELFKANIDYRLIYDRTTRLDFDWFIKIKIIDTNFINVFKSIINMDMKIIQINKSERSPFFEFSFISKYKVIENLLSEIINRDLCSYLEEILKILQNYCHKYEYIESINFFVNKLCIRNKIIEAENLVFSPICKDFKEEVIIVLLQYLSENTELKKFTEFLDQLKVAENRVIGLKYYALLLFRLKRTTDAYEIINKLPSEIQQDAYKDACVILFNQTLYDESYSIISKINDESLRLAALTDLTILCITSNIVNNKEQIKYFWDYAEKEIIDDYDLMQAAIKFSDNHIFDFSIKIEGFITDTEMQFDLFRRINSELNRKGRFHISLNRIKKSGFDSELKNILLIYQAVELLKQNFIQESNDIFEQNCDFSEFFYLNRLECCEILTESGRMNDATKILNEIPAIEICVFFTKETLKKLYNILFNTKLTRNNFNSFFILKDAIGKDFSKGKLITELTNKLIENNANKSAILIADNIKSKSLKNIIYSTIVSKNIELEEYIKAKEIIQNLEGETKGSALKELFQKIATEDQIYEHLKSIDPFNGSVKVTDESMKDEYDGWFYNKSIQLLELYARYRKKNDLQNAKKMILEAYSNIHKVESGLYDRDLDVEFAIEFSKLQLFEKALSIANSIKDISNRFYVLISISTEYMQFGLHNESENLTKLIIRKANKIEDKVAYNNVQLIIAVGLFKQNNYSLGISSFNNINLIHYRNTALVDLISIYFANENIQKTTKFISSNFSESDLIYARKGILRDIKLSTINKYSINDLLFLFQFDSFSIIKILTWHVFNNIFFQKNYPQEKLDKFNKALNIQWAIDIKNQLPN